MPFVYHIAPDYNLAFYQGRGVITCSDAVGLFESYATHPEACSGQNILCDLTDLREVRMDLDDRLRLQARMEPVLAAGGKPRLYVMYAPTALSQRLAETFAEFWEAAPLITVSVVRCKTKTAHILRLPLNIFDLMQARLS